MFRCSRLSLPGPAWLVATYLVVLNVFALANQFETRATFPVGLAPASIVVDDFNRDGKLDVAVVSAYNNFVQVLIGNGDGTFQTAVNYPASTPGFVVAADLNQDGKLDLVIGNGPSNVSVLLGNGDGTFQPAVPYSTPCKPVFIGIGDFNGDHKLDLIVHYSDGSCRSVAVLLGNGDGTFQEPPINTTPSYYPTAIGLGDFNRDGKLDAVVTEQFGTVSQVEILTGNGDGSFSLGKSYPVDSDPQAITVADLRGNGKLDLVVPTVGGETDVLLGNGDGTFNQEVRYLTFAGVWAVTADFNGDGKLDVAVAQITNPPGVSVLLGNGDGTFQPTRYYPFGGEVRTLGVGDFNRDHMIDMVVPDNLNSVVISVLNTGVVSFSPPTPPNYPFQLVGTTSSPQTVTLTNTGTAALPITSISVKGPFHARNTCGSSVAPGASCAISVVFKPTVLGSVSGTVTIVDSASSKPQVIYLTGIGTEVSLAPKQLTFAAQKVGTTSAPQQVQVTNTGSTALHFINIYIGGNNNKDFSQSNNCGSQIGAGASCTVTVTFTPTKTGTRRALVGFSDSGNGSHQSVPISGTGD